EVDVLVNYTKDPSLGIVMPSIMVDGANDGVVHSFQIKNDVFSQGDNRLVNHKTYYFKVIAYGFNEYEPYSATLGSGQDLPFIASRKSVFAEIPTIVAIPHKVDPENGGTALNSSYGDGVFLTRIEGKGNGLNDLTLTPESEAEILSPASGYVASELTYMPGRGPVNIKVVDPLLVPAADFELRLAPDNANLTSDTVKWQLINVTDNKVFDPYHSFHLETEDLIIGTGLSINWGQYAYSDPLAKHFTDLVSSSIAFDDPSRPWLQGLKDDEGFNPANWIRAGTVEPTADTPPIEAVFSDFKDGSADAPFTDENEVYEGVVGGTWSPYCLVSYTDQVVDEQGVELTIPNAAPTITSLSGDLSPINPPYISNIKGLNNVDVVITKNKDLWTRCPVLEMQGIPGLTESGDAVKMKMRKRPSVDKNGQPDGSGTNGMGWFPGYAIDVGTGERLNMAFGEDSWLVGENGRDMIWNPTSRKYTDIGNDALFGGQHWIYVFKNLRNEVEDITYTPRYDEGAFLYSQFSDPGLTTSNWKRIFRACTWVGSAILNPDYSLLPIQDGLIPNDVRISLRVANAYTKFSAQDISVDNTTEAENHWNPYYTFSTRNLQAVTGQSATLTSALDCINVVPNPYYAFSEYEANKLDNRVKITNLPEECTVTIYNLTGTLIRQYKKADPLTSLDWDLKNSKNIPIASGVYIIHIEVPGIGEKTLKWFGVMRPTDLDNF
ncbi:MAG: T9SS type A sorting domain-containing protein, partial [Nitrospirota bacterium]|nr:T9SS type A sorting domain-containing protein [Nitrospirota bacterium]